MKLANSSNSKSPREPASHLNHLIGVFPELFGIGGVQESSRLTAAALSRIAVRQGWAAHFLSLNDASGPHALEMGAQDISLCGFGRAKLRFVLAGVRRAHSFARNSSHIILAAHPHLAFPAVLSQALSRNVKSVVMAHGIEVWTPLPPLRRRALASATVVLAPSRYTAQRLVDVQGVAPDKIRTLPWPLNPQFLKLAAAPSDLPLPSQFPHGRIVLTVGRWAVSEQYKGADDLIRAVAQLCPRIPELQLVVVGNGDDLPRIKRLAASLGVDDCVHFFPNLSREQIGACYSRADVFALPSVGEGFGLVFLEAMAFAKPIVGAACGGTTDVVEDGINGLLVPPKDTQQLTSTLARLLCDDSLRLRLGRAGAEIVRNKYQFSHFEANLERILSSVGFPEHVFA